MIMNEMIQASAEVISINDHNSIHVKKGVKPTFGRVRDKDRCCYSTVTLMLDNTAYLEMRVEEDPEEQELKEYLKDLVDWENLLGRNEFWVEINNRDGDKLGVCLWYMDERGRTNSLSLTKEEQAIVINRVNRQCEEEYGKTCRQLLSDARKRMDPKELEGIEI